MPNLLRPSRASLPPDSTGSPSGSSTPTFRVEVAATPADLQLWVGEWDKLAEHSLVVNPFFESWMLLPALKAFADPAKTMTLLVFLENGKTSTLTGLAPLEKFRRFRGVPCRGLSLWKHDQCPLAIPLLHRDHAAETFGAILDWAAGQARLLDLDLVDAERSFGQMLTEVINARCLVNSIEDQYNRAFLRPRETAEAYIALSQGGRQRQEYRRQRRRLEDLGTLETRSLTANEPAEPWITDFFRLEASGWKGRANSAIATQANVVEFFRAAMTTAHAAGRLHMLGLFLNGKAIALKCNFLAGGGAFALKIAYDEAYAKSSPGVMLELDTIDAIHRDPRIAWMDSCACPNHPMIDRLWLDRRAIQRRVISTGSTWGNVVLGLTALGRALKRSLRRA